MRRTDLWMGFVAGLALSMLVGMIGYGLYTKQVIHFKEKVATAETHAATSDSLRKVAQATADSALALTDSVLALNAALRTRLAVQVAATAEARKQLVALDAAVQRDSACWRLCRPSIEARDTLLAQVAAQRDSAVVGLERSDSALKDTRQALVLSNATVAQQATTIASYKDAVAAAPGSTTFWKKLLPSVSVGAWGGWSMLDQTPDVVLGIGVGWEISP